jgi:hypothetical protein
VFANIFKSTKDRFLIVRYRVGIGDPKNESPPRKKGKGFTREPLIVDLDLDLGIVAGVQSIRGMEQLAPSWETSRVFQIS